MGLNKPVREAHSASSNGYLKAIGVGGGGAMGPTKSLLDEDSSDEDTLGDKSNGVPLPQYTDNAPDSVFKVNEEYARRFEYNKKREELHKLEEKYGKFSAPEKRKRDGDEEGDGTSNIEDSSSESEDEDDEGRLATEALDAEISATLQAIRAKDPRVYDESSTFYTKIDIEDGTASSGGEHAEKPMYLRDYHRRNLLEGGYGENGVVGQPKTYAQNQEDLRKSIIQEMHAAADGKISGIAADGNSEEDEEEDDGGFLISKSASVVAAVPEKGSAEMPQITDLDVEKAHEDPEQFLSSFMSARAWVPTPKSRFQPFESDDEEEDQRAEAFEEAYNFRFEDPKRANEKLLSHARDAAAKYSVRREEPNSRKKVRDLHRAKKEAEKKERETEIARLRRLKIEEVSEKVRKIREAAGLRGETVSEHDWVKLIDTDWDNDLWEEGMKDRFGPTYYDDREVEGDESDGSKGPQKRRKVKKPQWDEDIDIKDLIPEFEADEENDRPPFMLSDEEHDFENNENQAVSSAALDKLTGSRTNGIAEKTRRNQERLDRKKEARQERKRIEEIVNDKVNLEAALTPSKSKHAGQFRYRETSPLTYGLTARDILMASDSQLNQFAGLKKMAAFRDAEKKRKDKKRLGKKARLRQWRKETFGSEEGPQVDFSEALAPQEQVSKAAEENGDDTANIRKDTKRRRTSKKNKRKIDP